MSAALANLGPSEQRKRRFSGWALLIVTLALFGHMVGLEIPRGWRFLLVAPLFVSFLGFLQAKNKT